MFAVQVRTKVYKCLGCVVEADSRVLGLPNVAAAVRAALVDDSVAVKDATLELLAKLINTNPALAGEYFDVLVQASHVRAFLMWLIWLYIDGWLCTRANVLHCPTAGDCFYVGKWRCWRDRKRLTWLLLAASMRCAPCLLFCAAGPWHQCAQACHQVPLGLLHVPWLFVQC